jgi:glycosyltransferase involved in cell wall biosynthesis
MKVSAVIPAFNRRDYLPRAIDSALAQTVPVDELVVVDDGSTDGSAEFLQSQYGNRLRVVRQANLGVAGARRRGIQEARGEWIAFLDSDDEWLPDRNAKLVKAAECVPADVAWIFGDLSFVTDDGESPSLFGEYGFTLRENPQVILDPLSVQYPMQFCYFQGSFIRRAALLGLNCFSEGLRSDDDVLAGFQIGCRYKFAAIPSVVGKYYRTSDLASSSVVVNGSFRPDYYRSRMIAFATVIDSGRKRPWNSLYASQVRALCQLLDNDGPSPRMLALEQFRYGGFSVKGVAFMCAALTGRRGVQSWNAVAASLRRILRLRRPKKSPQLGHRHFFESLVEKHWH